MCGKLLLNAGAASIEAKWTLPIQSLSVKPKVALAADVVIHFEILLMFL